MKKNIILLVLFLLLSAASLTAQVRIGDTNAPNSNAVLDLNANTDTPNPINQGFVLPRVQLTSANLPAPLSAWFPGLLVYNTATGTGVTPGIYYCDGEKWVRLYDGQ
jgi:hypothetical protein